MHSGVCFGTWHGLRGGLQLQNYGNQFRTSLSWGGDILNFPMPMWSSLQHGDVHQLNAFGHHWPLEPLCDSETGMEGPKRPNKSPEGPKTKCGLKAEALHGHGLELCPPQPGRGQQGPYWHPGSHLEHNPGSDTHLRLAGLEATGGGLGAGDTFLTL